MQEALDVLTAQGLAVNAIRIRAYPFAQTVNDFVNAHTSVFVIEQNRDAQLKTLLVTDAKLDPAKLISLLHYDGTPITARFIVDRITQQARTVVPLKKAS
jgi:2-oxoglutarate ferredoxin oxidoreductase subunit alpha